MMYCLNVIETYFHAIRIAKQSDAVVSIKSEKTLLDVFGLSLTLVYDCLKSNRHRYMAHHNDDHNGTM